MIEIYPPGSFIYLFDDLKCRVIGISITGHEGHSTIRYEISWIVGGDRKTAWIESFEIKSSSENKLSVGFIAL